MLMQARTFIAMLVSGTAAVTASTAHAQDPARTEGWVVLALDDYRALRARAFPSKPDPLPPPVDATLTRVDYDLRVNGDTVTGEARLTVDVLKQGWVSIQMPAGMLVRGARLDGRPTALVDGTPPRVLVSRTGRSVIALEIVMPIASAGGLESMTLPASASALSAVTLDRAARRRRPHRERRLRRRADRRRDARAAGPCTALRAVRWRSPGSARSTTAARRCRCARARASPSSSRSARKAARSPRACASKSSRAWRATSCCRHPRASP